MKEIYVVTGATGNIGAKLSMALLAGGASVRVIGRERVRLGPLAAKGAEPWPGDMGDAAFLARAFAGAAAVFAMVPPRYDAPDLNAYQNRIGDALVAAVRKAGVHRVVNLSSWGAHLPAGTGPVRGLHDVEEKFSSEPDLHVVHLRPGFFMENLLGSIPTIRSQGKNAGPVRPDVPIPMIATKDIAVEAARLIREPFAGRSVRPLLGPRDLTFREATRILGAAIGKPDLAYLPIPYEEAWKTLRGIGMSESAADAMIEWARANNDGLLEGSADRSRGGATPTTLEEFARAVFAPLFRSAA